MEQNPNPPSWPWISSSSSSSHLSFDLAQIDGNEDDHEHRQSDDVVGPGPETVREEDREPMFEKSLTPSDVGKLNRLVIPKQHAEKHFPLGGGAAADKGFLLGFEDESGKPWRFRYSYWNSSQSYVLTKGWSRFVKEKHLNAGDVILFYRHCLDPARFFIGWRRRGGPATAHDSAAAAPWTSRGPFYAARPYPPPYHHQPPDHYPHAAGRAAAQIQGTTNPMGSPKRLRLFGVNLECQPDEPEPSGADASEPFGPDDPAVLSQGSVREQFYAQMYASSSSNQSYYTDLNFSRDINQMRNRRGG